jgi:hypothetical protein
MSHRCVTALLLCFAAQSTTMRASVAQAAREAEASAPAATLYVMASSATSEESVSDLYTVANYGSKPADAFVAASPLILLSFAIDPVSQRGYGLDYGNELYVVDLKTGNTTAVGPGPRAGFAALAFNNQGTGYEWGYDSILYLLDKASGRAAAVGSTGTYSGAALTFDNQGVLYGASNDGALVRIDPGTGDVTAIGQLTNGCCTALASDPAGNLYGANLSELYRVNKATGSATKLGAIALANPDPGDPFYIMSLAFAAQRGPAAASPTASFSWYVYVDSTASGAAGSPQEKYSPAMTRAWASKTGAVAQQRNLDSGGAANFILLDFGSPRMLNGVLGTNGLVSPCDAMGLPCFANMTTIANVVKAFIEGYAGAAKPLAPQPLYLAIGLTNEYQPEVMKCPGGGKPQCESTGVPVNQIGAHGTAWAEMLAGLRSWVAGQGYPIFIVSGVDVEMDYGTPAETLAWYEGFAQAPGAQDIAQYDFGDATCVRSGSCGNGWTAKQIATLPNMNYMPEIYFAPQVTEWEEVAMAAPQTLPIAVILTGNTNCASCPKNCDTSGGYSPCAAWTQLTKALQANPKTAPVASQFVWSTDLGWRP